VRRDLGDACNRAGIDPVSPNNLRRTYASWLKQRGVDSAVVAKLLGHTSTRMVDLVYGHLADDTLAAAVGPAAVGLDGAR
jgi:integrase